MSADDSGLAEKLAVVLPYLDERQRRVVMGAEARALGRGGIRTVARAAGVSEPTVSKAVRELSQPAGQAPHGRVRRPGGGRRPLTETDPGLVAVLEALVDPATRGDPQSPLLWTSKSTRELADALAEQGHKVSHVTVGALLRARGYSLQAAAKTREGRQHPDRDAQFRYLTGQLNAYLDAGDPVVSVDTKRSCDTRSHAASEPAEWRAGLCRMRSFRPVLDGLAPPLTCAAGNGGVRSSRERRRTPVPSGGYGQGADRTGESREPSLMSRYA